MGESGVGACWRCGTAIASRLGVGRRDACLGCGTDLRCCRQCRFYDPSAPDQCREPQAERQVDKERANFCEWFGMGAVGVHVDTRSADARARLDAMFSGKKRPR